MNDLDRPSALRLIDALRSGSDSLEDSARFSVGRERLLQAADQILEEIEVTEGASVRWVKGRYGQGKTHLFGRIVDLASERNWVSSYVVVSGPREGTDLSRFDEILSAIHKNISVSSFETSGRPAESGNSGWRVLLQRWYERILKRSGATRSGDIPTLRVTEVIGASILKMQSEDSVAGSFLEALREYALACLSRDLEWQNVLLQWFQCEDVHSRGGAVRARLREAGIRESIKRQNAKENLRYLTCFLSHLGYGGLLIQMDEVENVLRYTPKARHGAYTILRELIDNVDGRFGMKSTCLYAAGTPDLFESENGIAEYEALAERVLLDDNRANPFAPVVDLDRQALTEDNYVEMGDKIVGVYGLATGQEPSPNVGISKLFDDLEDPAINPRLWARTVVAELDAARV